MKNIEKIKNMPLDEMADFLSEIENCGFSTLTKDYCEVACEFMAECLEGGNCVNDDLTCNIKWWLNKEVEE